MSILRARIYLVLAILFFIGGVGFDLVVFSSYARMEPLNYFEEILYEDTTSILYLIFAMLALIFLSALVYVVSLDPFRADRPWGLVYLNFMPVSLYAGVVFLPLLFTDPEMTNPIQIGVVLAFGFFIPLIFFAIESILARVLLSLGRSCDQKEMHGAAFFFLKNSLRWRPSVQETARRCGLILMESARYKAARGLLERLEPIATSQDYEVVKSLERIYSSEGENLLALRCLQRMRQIKPGAKGLELRILDQCMALEQWDDAVELLISGKIEMDTERLAMLVQIYVRTGRIPKALDVVRQMSEKEPLPFTRSTGLLREILRKSSECFEAMTLLGRLLQRSKTPEKMQEGADWMEKSLAQESGQIELRRQLAQYYQQTMQIPLAEAHFKKLVAARDSDPESYLGYAEILKASDRSAEAVEVYQTMRKVLPDDWRPWFREAEYLAAQGKFEEARKLSTEAESRAPDSAKLNLNVLKKKISQRLEEQNLKSISEELNQHGEDVRKRLAYIEQLIALDRGDQAVTESDNLLSAHPELIEEVQRIIETGLSKVVQGFRLRDCLADLYFRQGRYDDTLKMFKAMSGDSLHPDKIMEQGCRKILTRVPEHVPARLLLGELQMKSQNWPGALEVYWPLVGNPPAGERLQIMTNWVEALYQSGKVSEAKDEVLAVLHDFPDSLPLHLLAIRILEDNNDYQQAYDVFKQAQARHPNDESLRQMRRAVADNKKRNRMEELLAAESRNQLTPSLHYEKADLHRDFDQTHQAIIHYQRAAEEAELAEIALTKMSICLCDRRLFDMAIETLDQFELTRENVDRHPDLKNMFYWIAETLETENYKEASLKYFKRIFRVDASFKDVVLRLEKLDSR